MHERIRVNLQHFAEPAPAAPSGATPAPSAPAAPAPEAPKPSISDKLGAMFDDANKPQPQAPAQQQPGNPALAAPKLYAGKYDTPEKLEEAYKNIQGLATRTAQEKAELVRQYEALKAENARLQQPPKPAEPPAAEPQFDAKKYQELLYEDPAAAVKMQEDYILSKINKTIEERTSPVQQKVEQYEIREAWNDSTTNFQAQHPDMMEFIDDMRTYINERKLGNSRSPQQVLNDAYYYAKGLKYQPAQPVQQPTPADLMNDPNFINTLMGNAELVNKIIQQHASGVLQSQQMIPKPIDSSATGAPPAVPPNRPRNLNEAGQSALARLTAHFAGGQG